MAAVEALPETDNARSSDGDGAGARGERDAGVGVGEKRGKEVTTNLRVRGRINGPHSKTIWAKSQLRFKVRHYRMRSTALPHGRCGTGALPKIV